MPTIKQGSFKKGVSSSTIKKRGEGGKSSLGAILGGKPSILVEMKLDCARGFALECYRRDGTADSENSEFIERKQKPKESE